MMVSADSVIMMNNDWYKLLTTCKQTLTQPMFRTQFLFETWPWAPAGFLQGVKPRDHSSYVFLLHVDKYPTSRKAVEF